MIIDRYGIVKNNSDKKENVNMDSVNTCKLILQYIKERANFYDEATSYNYKHHIERFFSQTHIYIGNGDFIQGAIDLNLHVKPYNNHIPSDGIFKFTENDFYLASIEYYLNHNKIQPSSNNIIKIKNDILNCKNLRSRITIDDFIKLFSRLHINISKTDIFLLLISDFEIFDWSHSSDKFTSFHDIMNNAKLKINRNQLKTALSK